MCLKKESLSGKLQRKAERAALKWRKIPEREGSVDKLLFTDYTQGTENTANKYSRNEGRLSHAVFLSQASLSRI